MKSFLLICSIVFFIISCSDDEKKTSSSSMFGIGVAAVESLPQVRTQTKGRTIVSGTIADHSTLSTFFKLECIMPGMDDFCPAGVDATTGGDSNPYKLTSYTLIGSIYHADMYSGGLKTECEGSSTTITTASFVAADAGGQPAKFLLDYYDLLTCTGQVTSESGIGDGTKYQAYSVDVGATYQATLTTRYRNPYDGISNPGQNDIFQVYVGLNGDTPVFLGYNYAGADSMFQRTVLLVNLVTHRFAVKHFESSTNKLVAIGVGGVNLTTGVLNTGYYFTKFTDNFGAEEDSCVDNATGSFQTDITPCTGASVPVNWSNTDDVADYLGMTTDDKTRLAAFLLKFSDDVHLTVDDSPANNTTDPEQNFPMSITP